MDVLPAIQKNWHRKRNEKVKFGKDNVNMLKKSACQPSVKDVEKFSRILENMITINLERFK